MDHLSESEEPRLPGSIGDLQSFRRRRRRRLDGATYSPPAGPRVDGGPATCPSAHPAIRGSYPRSTISWPACFRRGGWIFSAPELNGPPCEFYAPYQVSAVEFDLFRSFPVDSPPFTRNISIQLNSYNLKLIEIPDNQHRSNFRN
ncbi:hypothetical protein GWI33_001114 [Rhynchophorus ferrugineus]|uniref:Uncharacterized protein n=1 Tax=Rhynchophorus ferrugineus TaxID=354439 RepID=A0A834LXH1_RHYFE|nr:hypothetical protein GWI33_001114 [Rhynchophorus ferrugineus]